MKKHKDKSGSSLHNGLAECVSKIEGARRNNKDAVICLAKFMTHEKTGPANSDCVHGKAPKALESYIKIFCLSETRIIDSPTMITGEGFQAKPHEFLAVEG